MTARGFRPALRGELFLFPRSRAVRWAVLITLAVPLVRVSLGAAGQAATRTEKAARQAGGGLAAGGAGPLLETNAWGPFADGLGSGLAAAAVLLIAISAASLALDRELGLARLPLTRRSSRGALLLARFTALNLLGFLLALLAAGSALAASSLFHDFGPVAEDGFVIFPQSEILAETTRGAGLALLGLPAAAALGLLVGAAAPTGAAAAAGAVLLALSWDAAKGLLGQGAGWVFLTFLPSAMDRSYLAEVSSLARGFSDAGYSSSLLALNLALPVPQALLLLGLAGGVLARRRM